MTESDRTAEQNNAEMRERANDIVAYLYRCEVCAVVQATTMKCTPAIHHAHCFVCHTVTRVYPVRLDVFGTLVTPRNL